MTKVAIKNENITSFGGIYHIMMFFQSWVLNTTEGKSILKVYTQ